MRIIRRKIVHMDVRSALTPVALTVAALFLFYPPISAAQNEAEIAEMKEEIKQEILRELRQSVNKDASESVEIEALKEELKREILQELLDDIRNKDESPARESADNNSESQQPAETPGNTEARANPSASSSDTQEHSNTGIAEGQILRQGVGLPKCDVKLVLVKTETRATSYQRGREYKTITDENGFYKLEGLIPGGYKLKWQLPGDTGWIRRLRQRPDVVIEAGGRAKLSPLETERQLASR